MRLRRVLIYSALLFVWGCDNSTPEPELIPEVLESSTVLATRSQTDISAFIKSRSLPVPTDQIKSSVTAYKITYKTTFKDQQILASGLVILPDSQEDLAMLSFQHGTIAAHSEAPSALSANAELLTFYSAIAAPGIIGVAPDLIGFGVSSNVVHPYYLEEPTAAAVVDCIKAARELAITKGFKFNKKLFLAGYSQGGYATMAAHKWIQANGLAEFDLIASFPASGGYNIKGVQEYFFKQTTYADPFYLAYVAYAYKTHLGFTQPLTDLFKEPYASRIPGLFNGQNTAGQINAQLTTKIADLIQADVLANIDTDPKYKYMTDAFKAHSVGDWKPDKKVYMYHGDIDVTVPYENSVAVYNSFIAQGASQSVVTFTPLPFATHGTGVTPYIIHLINGVLSMK